MAADHIVCSCHPVLAHFKFKFSIYGSKILRYYKALSSPITKVQCRVADSKEVIHRQPCIVDVRANLSKETN